MAGSEPDPNPLVRGTDPVGSGDLDTDPYQNVTDPQH
jgi:hypothetical protein